MPLILRGDRLVKCTKEVDEPIETLLLKLGEWHKPNTGRYWVIVGCLINLAAVDWTEEWN
jgi:hypothetical protein